MDLDSISPKASNKTRATRYETRNLENFSRFYNDRFAIPREVRGYYNTTQPVWLLGEGLVYYKDKFKADGIRFLDKHYWTPRAEKVHLLGWKMALKGQFADALTLQPTYSRRPEAEEK